MSTRNLDCLELMNALPDICFPIPFQQNEVSLDMLRVDDCLQTFEKITVNNVNNNKRKFQEACGEEVSSHSPVGVDGVHPLWADSHSNCILPWPQFIIVAVTFLVVS